MFWTFFLFLLMGLFSTSQQNEINSRRATHPYKKTASVQIKLLGWQTFHLEPFKITISVRKTLPNLDKLEFLDKHVSERKQTLHQETTNTEPFKIDISVNQDNQHYMNKEFSDNLPDNSEKRKQRNRKTKTTKFRNKHNKSGNERLEMNQQNTSTDDPIKTLFARQPLNQQETYAEPSNRSSDTPPLKQIKKPLEHSIKPIYNSQQTRSFEIAKTECDVLKKKLPPRVGNHITFGEDAIDEEFPHMAALGYIIDYKLKFNCGGSLISDYFVVTTGHCVVNVYDVRPHLVRMGTIYLDNGTKDTDYAVEDIIIHPSFDTMSKYNDIALIKLKKWVKPSANIFPACIYLKKDEPINLIVTGWGFIDHKNIDRSKKLQKATLAALSKDKCQQEYAVYKGADLLYGITEQQMCAIDPKRDQNAKQTNKDTCNGDSGGPIQIKENDHISIVGMTSFSNSQCGFGGASVYIKLLPFLDWIVATVWP